jgi:hypothetical protein
MAAVTITAQRTDVNGSYREKFYILTIADTNTLVTGMHIIKTMSCNDTAVTKMTASGGTITFASSGGSTGALVRVLGL